MKKKATLAILIAFLLMCMPVPASAETTGGTFAVIKVGSSGPDVSLVQMRLRDLGYLNYRPTGMVGTLTRTAAMRFQELNALSPDGDIGEQTFKKMFALNIKRNTLPADVKFPSGPPDNKKTKKYGTADDWFSVVSTAFPKGVTAVVTDFNTGTSYTVKRTGGENHAEVETLTKSDTKTFLKTLDKSSGKSFTWEKRPVTVEISGKTYAASIFGWPHGEDSIADNDMTGAVCLYFTGSLSDVYGLKDPEHDAVVKVAVQK